MTGAEMSDTRRDLINFAPLLAGCVWVLATWLICLSLAPPRVAVRWMVFSCLAGLVLVWPAWRLSQGAEDPAGRVVRDGLWLIMIVQLIVGPLALLAGWSPGRALLVDLGLVTYIALAGAVAAAGRLREAGWARSLATAACAGLFFIDPLLAMAGAAPAVVGPLSVFWHLVGPQDEAMRVLPVLVSTALAAGLIWAAVAMAEASSA